MTTTTAWLDDTEQTTWRRLMRLQALLPARMNQHLRDAAGLSLSDYEVLVCLTDQPDHRLRISDVAATLHWERSRLSHHLTRMETRGLIRREECPEDGRGAFATLTEAGLAAITDAAPLHVQEVRRWVFDGLDRDEVEALGAITAKILARLGEG